MTHPETINDLKKYVEQVRRQRDSLEKRYGSGVRPSYVSADLAILDECIDRYTDKIERLTNE